MSHFYGYLTGNRGTITRCGCRKSGINAHIRSWDNDVHASIEEGLKGKDKLILEIPVGMDVEINGKKHEVTQ